MGHSSANWIISIFTTYLMSHAQYTWSSFHMFSPQWCSGAARGGGGDRVRCRRPCWGLELALNIWWFFKIFIMITIIIVMIAMVIPGKTTMVNHPAKTRLKPSFILISPWNLCNRNSFESMDAWLFFRMDGWHNIQNQNYNRRWDAPGGRRRPPSSSVQRPRRPQGQYFSQFDS